MPTKAFTYFSDPGHGWLRVSAADCLDLGLTSRDFSAYSHIGGVAKIYLEEDLDAPKFLAAYEAKYGHKPIIREKYTNRNSRIRNMRQNGKTDV